MNFFSSVFQFLPDCYLVHIRYQKKIRMLTNGKNFLVNAFNMPMDLVFSMSLILGNIKLVNFTL